MTDSPYRFRAFESLEQRLVMSAQTLSDVVLNPQVEPLDPWQQAEVAGQRSGGADALVRQVHEQYRFDGSQQTVVIIDSGIAWDHLAFGGGYGQGHHVVGGWDFAENDANPYDDGPAGYHGTHVAGIVGSANESYRGVAPGADIVALRVFDDNGMGKLEWIERALQWVHDHKDDFANPITTVNLSVGTNWNGNSVPPWAILEDEFSRLEVDGMFISVAAGNSFEDYSSTGLSYPATSPLVVPVASHDQSGYLSNFSQRNHRVLVAPGEDVVSSVPGHLYAGPARNSYLGASGTSMAAPYVAGASMLLRQANLFMGVNNIDQDMLYQQFRQTADFVFDQTTGGYYYRINLSKAIEAAIADLNDDGWNHVNQAGTLNGGETISGTIGTIDDRDHFSFRAGASGKTTFTVNATHELQPDVIVQGAQAKVSGNQITFNVVAGQTYKFSIGTDDGIGHYHVGVGLTKLNLGKDLGVITSSTINQQIVKGDNWFRMTAARDGILAVSSRLSDGAVAAFQLMDSNMKHLDSDWATASSRLQTMVTRGQTIYLKVISDAPCDVEIRANNLISVSAGKLSIHGTRGNDQFQIHVGQNIDIVTNGMGYRFNAANIYSIQVQGNTGYDSLQTSVSQRVDSAWMAPSQLDIQMSTRSLSAAGVEAISLAANAQTGLLYVEGGSGNDSLDGATSRISISGPGYRNSATGFSEILVRASAGFDRADIQGSAAADRFTSLDDRNVLVNNEGKLVAHDFEIVSVRGRGGHDTAYLFDTLHNDFLTVGPMSVHFVADDNQIWGAGFEHINVYAGRGYDTVEMNDSKYDDKFWHRNGISVLTQDGAFTNAAKGFQLVQARS
jgi:subtilisin family serine protease